MLNQFREQLLANDSLEERVEVNQRHLIDKILARYSAEYTVFRELIQNANDAEATELKIRFNTPNHKSPATFNNQATSEKETNNKANRDQPLEPHTDQTSVQKTVDNKLVTLKESYDSIIVSNNGKFFSDKDWNRLKKIAEGNPDEQKIGFFGVGFYSLFSICEEPFVLSGNECMAFYWKGDQLYTKKSPKGDIKVGLEDDDSIWTLFFLQMRDGVVPVPEPKKFGRFLATAVAFTKYLKTIRVYLDDNEVFFVNKKQSEVLQQNLSSGYSLLGLKRDKYRLESPQGLFAIKSMNKYSFEIHCEYIDIKVEESIISSITKAVGGLFVGSKNSAAIATKSSFLDRKLGGFFSSWISGSRNLPSEEKAEKGIALEKEQTLPETVEKEQVNLIHKTEKINLKLSESFVGVNVTKQMADQMERSTKKLPPKSTQMQVIWGGMDNQQVQTSSGIELINSKKEPLEVLGQLAAYPMQGSVFIGFATHQTTGCSAHMAAPFIPTVERESIDFVDPTLAKWNRELLTIFGIMCRILHDSELEFIENEFADVKNKLNNLSPRTTVSKIINSKEFSVVSLKSATINSFFTPKSTTPSTLLGEIYANVLFGCCRDTLPVLTTKGVLSVNSARLYSTPEKYTSDTPEDARAEWSRKVQDSPSLLELIYDVPLIPPEVHIIANGILSIAYSMGQLTVINTNDVISDISKSGPIGSNQAVGLLRWWLTLPSKKFNYQRAFLDSITVLVTSNDYIAEKQNKNTLNQQDEDGWPNVKLPLNKVKYTIDTGLTPPFEMPSFANFDPEIIKAIIYYPTRELPYPIETLPLSISSKFTKNQLQELFFDSNYQRPMWVGLSLKLWLEHLLGSKMLLHLLNMTQLPETTISNDELKASNNQKQHKTQYPFAHHVLETLNKAWHEIDPEQKVLIVSLLSSANIIPTIHGLQKPLSSYFSTANLFPDLPILLKSVGKVAKEQLLMDLGIKKHVDLQLIFDRIDTELKWDHIQLIKYLAGVSNTLTEYELARLKSADIFPPARIPNAQSNSLRSQPENGGQAKLQGKYRASQLHFPSDKLINLELPVLKWNNDPGNKFAHSKEGQFMKQLGMRIHPTCADLLVISVKTPLEQHSTGSKLGFDNFIDSAHSKRTLALDYLIGNYDPIYRSEYSNLCRNNSISFLPALVGSYPVKTNEGSSSQQHFTQSLEHPNNCFANPGCAIMNFAILDKRWRRDYDKLLVQLNPPVHMLTASAMKCSFINKEHATLVFEYLSTRQSDFAPSNWKEWQNLKIVPIFNSEGTKVLEKLSPKQCYFNSSSANTTENSKDNAYKSIFFKTIDFGPRAALFLRACGVKDEPLPTDLATQLVTDPTAFLRACNNDYEIYLNIIRQLARNYTELQKNKNLWRTMTQASWLVAIQKKGPNLVTDSAQDTKGENNKDEDSMTYSLAKPVDIVVVDDMFLAQQLEPLCAPTDPLTEQFYLLLGSTWLRDAVVVTNHPVGEPEISHASIQLEKMIKERASLLLYEFSTSSSTHHITGEQDYYLNPTKDNKLKRNVEWLQTKLVVRQVKRIDVKHKFKLTDSIYRTTSTACAVSWDKETNYIAQNNSSSTSLRNGVSGFANPFSVSSIINNITSGSNSQWHCILISPSVLEATLQNPFGDNSGQVQNWDSFDVAMALGTLTLKQCRLNDALLISTLLNSSLDSLRRKGFPVDRILQTDKQKALERVIKSQTAKSSNSPTLTAEQQDSKLSNPHTTESKSTSASNIHDNLPQRTSSTSENSGEAVSRAISELTKQNPHLRRSQIINYVLEAAKQQNAMGTKNDKIDYLNLLNETKKRILKSEPKNDSIQSLDVVKNSSGLPDSKQQHNGYNGAENSRKGNGVNSAESPPKNYNNLNGSGNEPNNTQNAVSLDSAFNNLQSIKQSIHNAVKSTPTVSGSSNTFKGSNNQPQLIKPNSDQEATSSSVGNRLSKLFSGFSRTQNNAGKDNSSSLPTYLPNQFETKPHQDVGGNALTNYPDNDVNNPNSLISNTQHTRNFQQNGLSLCKPPTSQQLRYYGLVDDIDLYIDSNFGDFDSYETLLSAYSLHRFSNSEGAEYLINTRVDSFKLFAKVLGELATNVFQIPKQSMHMYIGGENTTTIAFNRAKVLFFNIDYFVTYKHALKLVSTINKAKNHENQLLNSRYSSSYGELLKASERMEISEVYGYWFMTACHELAHHFVADHNQEHGFYMSSFAEQYIPNLVKLLK